MPAIRRLRDGSLCYRPLVVHERCLWSLGELASWQHCVACGAAAVVRRECPWAPGATPIALDEPLPEVPLCRTCDVALRRATSRRVPHLTLLAVATPLTTAVIVLLVPFASLIVAASGVAAGMLPLALASWRQRGRTRAVPVLVIGARGLEVELQLSAGPAEVERPAPYRAPDPSPTMRRPCTDVRGIAAPGRWRAFASTGVSLLTGLWALGWSYPPVRIDNPWPGPRSYSVDGGPEVEISGRDRHQIRLRGGEHRIVTSSSHGGREPVVVEVQPGMHHLFSVGGASCYRVTQSSSYRHSGYAGYYSQSRIRREQWFAYEGSLDRMKCP